MGQDLTFKILRQLSSMFMIHNKKLKKKVLNARRHQDVNCMWKNEDTINLEGLHII